MEEWARKIDEGMRLIIDGCKGNNDWTACHRECPFDEFCTSIYKDEETEFTTPDRWEEETEA